MTRQSQPVTVVVRRMVRPGAEQAYEDWLNRLTAEAHGLAGYLGAEFFPPKPPDRNYVSVFRFDTPENLAAFETSDMRRRYLAEVTPLVEADAVWKKMTGLELWFEPPQGTVVPQPSPFRMALLLIAVVYILVYVIGGLVSMVIGDWPYALRLFITITIEVFLMTYLLMPRLTRWLSGWIYPTAKTVGAPQ